METLNSIFFYHLDKAIKTYRQMAQSKLKDSGFKITIDQWLVLKAIDDKPGISQVEISGIVFKDKASVTRIIESLVRSKYLQRKPHPDSGRRKFLTVTPKGKTLLRNIMPIVLKNRKLALENISQKNLQTAEQVLKSIAGNCKKQWQ